MNPDLDRLQTYPFQKLAALLDGIAPPPGKDPIALYIGEPKHPTPPFIRQTLVENLDGLAGYPPTAGGEALRSAIADWLRVRYRLDAVDPRREVIPVTGSREALFAFAQAVIDPTQTDPVVVCPNPFYQIYEGAALLAGANPHYLNTLPERGYAFDFAELPDAVWQRVQLVYVCSPGNPTGHVMSLEEWQRLFDLSDRHGFVIASDECYSEIHFDETQAPLGALQASFQLGRKGWPRLVMFSSLSKRSNVPGMRSGFVAGDAAILEKFLLYRTYHGCAMSPPVQAASAAAWKDEAHVIENRRLYRQKFAAALDILRPVMDVEMPEAAFYLWPRTPLPDPEFARRLYQEQAVSVLPGSFLARTARGVNPGAGRVRIALVASVDECAEAARRIRAFVENL
ncbi:MAG: succinyldiaminopimelate transaminase [Betaproteobacteria bacterium]|nr:MAG: succinyldiaminopimelate transaminase [Betaproteobacteria bacterium SG8_41]UCF74477.1 MAG: succinyldiaminopimelate transaminase [Betaproteobacteria bacterium]